MMDKKSIAPFFSVIICTYNRAQLIGRALDSLVSQNETDWEGLIIDDASTDHTKEALQPYLSKYNLRYQRHTHRGCALSKNAGMEAARGKYLTFLDSDDEYMPDHLQIRKKLLLARPEIDLLHSNVTIVGNPYVPDTNHPEKLIHINECIVGGTFFIKRNSLGVTDQFRDTYSDDSRFLIRFGEEGKVIEKIDAPTYKYYRDAADSLCNVKSTY